MQKPVAWDRREPPRLLVAFRGVSWVGHKRSIPRRTKPGSSFETTTTMMATSIATNVYSARKRVGGISRAGSSFATGATRPRIGGPAAKLASGTISYLQPDPAWSDPANYPYAASSPLALADPEGLDVQPVSSSRLRNVAAMAAVSAPATPPATAQAVVGSRANCHKDQYSGGVTINPTTVSAPRERHPARRTVAGVHHPSPLRPWNHALRAETRKNGSARNLNESRKRSTVSKTNGTAAPILGLLKA